MKTKVKLLPVLLILALVLLATGCGGEKTSPSGQSTEPIKLRFANYYAAESGPGTIGQVFADDVKEITNGRVIVEYYPGGMLLTADKMYDGVVQGIADIGLSNLGYTFGR
ncbi:MAG: C4-dicarboxylate ABC transporter substrate-binding protein, partial [Desulfotomaculaceae bacterium]|nr:C4-dicarboxylate ABC transporter substrate-binding protein [Desulfotomaculaceae bacterium]